ncbi:hypothetical protein A0U89_15755 (plasmid) [Kozakia baliensis]|uniref:Uncharacterized protein n=1 Tax=Kozakia baliensis TaxID=153496 RepID=A0A1D8UYR4_9PROT|nr:hypothetical protein A0U89_15755 [Kozakia baliensis]
MFFTRRQMAVTLASGGVASIVQSRATGLKDNEWDLFRHRYLDDSGRIIEITGTKIFLIAKGRDMGFCLHRPMEIVPRLTEFGIGLKQRFIVPIRVYMSGVGAPIHHM